MPGSRDSEEVYLLAKAPETLRMDDLIETMRKYGGHEMKTNRIEGEEALKKVLEKVTAARRAALSKLTLKDLLIEDV
jgi:DNA-binding IscR family transcriptional regulator